MIYLDNNATTAVDSRVFEAMLPYLKGMSGNPSSIHSYGQKAKGALTKSSKTLASIFGVESSEVLFTSGATEALNLLIRSVSRGGSIITSSLEHAAVLEPLKICGSQILYLDPEPGKGSISPKQIEEAIRPDTRMIVITAANNETGVQTDLEGVASVAEHLSIPLVIDGVALLGKEIFRIPKGVSAICFSGHKIHAPPGIGMAVVRKTFKLNPLIVGGMQQRGLRGGTENLPGIVALNRAIELIDENPSWVDKIISLRDKFEEGLLNHLPQIHIHGIQEKRISNTSNISFPGIDGETLLMYLDRQGIAASHGAACTTGTLQPSRVLLNMGISNQIARSSLRFSFSRMNTIKEVEQSIAIITQVVQALEVNSNSLMF